MVDLAESALHISQGAFGGEDFYPDLIDKAAVLPCGLAWSHPLVDAICVRTGGAMTTADHEEEPAFSAGQPAGPFGPPFPIFGS